MVSLRSLTHQDRKKNSNRDDSSRQPLQIKVDAPDADEVKGPQETREKSDESKDDKDDTSTRSFELETETDPGFLRPGRPKLSVITKGFGQSASGSGNPDKRQHSATSFASHIKGLISPSLSFSNDTSIEGNRASLVPTDQLSAISSRAGSGSENRADSVNATQIVSLIDEEDMEEFKLLQDDFKAAIESGEKTWLPKQATAEKRQSEIEGGVLSNLENEEEQQDEDETVQIRNQDPGGSRHSRIESRDGEEEDEDVKEVQIETSQTINEDLNGATPPLERKILSSAGFALYGKSLGRIPPDYELRRKIATLLLNKWEPYIISLLNWALVIYLCQRFFYGGTDIQNGKFHTLKNDAFLIVFNTLFTLEVFAKCVAFGLWDDSQMFYANNKKYRTIWEISGIAKIYQFVEERYGKKLVERIFPFKIDDEDDNQKIINNKRLRTSLTIADLSKLGESEISTPRAFARSSWNRVDLFSAICFWIALALSFRNYDYIRGIRIFKALSVVRILRLTTSDTKRSSILRCLKYGLPQLINVGFMLLYFWVLFGILGVQSFGGSLRRNCVWVNPEDSSESYDNQFQFCGGYLDPITKTRRNYLYSNGNEGPLAKGFLCPQNSKCISGQNPYQGTVSFDNIINSMELVFVIMSANTFTDIMYYTMDSDNMAACIFFISSILFLNIWLINLLIAVLVSSLERANESFNRKEELGQSDLIASIIRSTRNYIRRKATQDYAPKWNKKCIKFFTKCEQLFNVLIFADVIMQATVTSSVTENWKQVVLNFDQGTSIALLCESLIRLILHSACLWKFLANPSYVFDFLNSIICLVVTVPHIRASLGQNFYWLNVFLVVRFYRVIKSMKITRNLWKRVLGNAVMIANLTGFYFLFLFLVTIIVSLFFEGVVSTDEMSDSPFAMYTIPNSFLTLFIIASTENWTESLYELQQNAPNISSQFFGSALLIIWFFMANFVMLNIFIGLIAESLDVKEEDKRPLQIQHYLRHVYPQRIKDYTSTTLASRLKKKLLGRSSRLDTQDFRQFLFRGTAILSIAQQYEQFQKRDLDLEDKAKSKRLRRFSLQRMLSRILPKKLPGISNLRRLKNNPFRKKPEVVYSEISDPSGSSKKYVLQLNEFEDEKLAYLREHPTFNNSYFIFPPSHIFRKFCQSLVNPSVGKRTDGRTFFNNNDEFYGESVRFQHFRRDVFTGLISIATIIMVVLSCYITPLYRMKHLNSSRELWTLPMNSEAAFVLIFSLEFIIKTVADGLVHTPNAYIRNPWNCIDLIVLFSLWINFLAALKNNNSLSRIFRGLTALRALRCLTISKTARSTFNQILFDGIGKIVGAAVVSLSLLFPFTVWGMGLFSGRLGTCNDSLDLDLCYNEYTNTVFQWDVLMPRVYSEPLLYLNSFSSALRSLYEIISLEGWVDLLSNSMSSTGVGTVPEPMASPQNALFFVLFNFSSMVFILTLFVSFIISNHARTTGSAYFTIQEKSWLEVQKLFSQARPESSPDALTMSPPRSFFYRLAVEKTNFFYASFLQLVLYLHIFTLLLGSYQEQANVRNYQNVYFMLSSTVFLLQESFYLYGKGVRLWFAQRWAVFKFFIVTTSFALNVANLCLNRTIYGFTNVHGIFQLSIFLFVIPQNDILSELINTAMASFPSILSLIYTWGILFLVYAIAMNQIFGLTKLGPNTTDNINFRTVTKSLIVLFRCSFGEGWNYIMDDLTLNSPFCSNDTDSSHSDCGSKTYAYVLMMSWNILSMYIFLNMFVSLVLESFSYLYHSSAGASSVASRESIRKFKNAWKKFDPDGVGEIEEDFLPKLMHSFDGPLSFKIWDGRLSVKNLVKNYMKVNPTDPYDVRVDLEGLNTELNSIDRDKIIERKQQYRKFVQEARYVSAFSNGIKFSRIIQQIPLYTVYNPQECLGIDDYVRRLYVMGKVDKFLSNERNVDVLEMTVTRWKYLSHKLISQKSGVAHGREESTKRSENVFSDDNRIDIPNITVESDIERSVVFRPPGTPRVDYGINTFSWSPSRGLGTKNFDSPSDAEPKDIARNILD
ncbi:LAMI_0G02674g1_1 [Lachancea mirantina]|uniref:Calcium-channel protein CCH1 n=1 Tax=Lachancea mirantina TaxID=1230905 RepID=A0A1G4K7V5_9SACH|nr:LAMI_0G02674g1_1 [Lachancea mirantina]